MDPLAEKAPYLTPFRCAANNPINYIDPYGRWEVERGKREIMKNGEGTGKYEYYIKFVAEKMVQYIKRTNNKNVSTNMKHFIIMSIVLLWSTISCSAQIKQMPAYQLEKTDDEGYTIFKVKGKTYTFFNGTFYNGKRDSVIFQKPENNTIVFFEIYNDKYLFATIIDSTKEEVMSSIGYSIRYKKYLYVVSLKQPQKRWFFDCKYMFSGREIKSFNPLKGELIYDPLPKRIKSKSE